MGRIVNQVKVSNFSDPSKSLVFSAMVDTGSSMLCLPTAWRDRLGSLEKIRDAEVVLGDQSMKEAAIYGPVRIELEGFNPIMGEVIFLEMQAINGEYEPLIGYLVLEAANIAVDMVGHRLVQVRRMDLR